MSTASSNLPAGAAPIPANAGRRTASLRIAVLAVSAGLLLALVPFLERPVLYFTVLAMAFAVIAPIWFQWRKGTLDLFSPIHVVGGICLSYFGIASIWLVNNPRDIAMDPFVAAFVPRATIYCLLGILAMQLGFWGVFRKKVKDRAVEQVPKTMMFVVVPGALGFLGHAAQAAMHKGSPLPIIGSVGTSSLSQLSPLFLLSWALCWLLVLAGNKSRQLRWFFFAVMCPAALGVLVLGIRDKSLLLSLAVVPLIALWYTRRKFPLVPLVALVLILIFIIFPFVNTFRLLDSSIPIDERFRQTMNTLDEWSGERYWDRSVVSFQGRMALINSVAVVIRDTGRWMPYAKGETLFAPVFVYFIPRVIWPDKPTFTFGRDFGVMFRMVNILDEETKIAATVPGELYWNFGVPGIVFGMAIWGIAMRLAYRRYGEVGHLDPIRRAISILLLIQFIHYGGGLAGDIVGTIRPLILLELYRWISLRVEWSEYRPSVMLPKLRGAR